MSTSRRTFVKDLMIGGMMAPYLLSPLDIMGQSPMQDKLEVHLFSKHLQFLGYRAVAEKAAELGFAGLDLTVRPNGHVQPERVETDLPRALAEIHAGGSSCKMITTAVESIDRESDRNLLKVAGELGITFYRSNWVKYLDGKSMPDSLAYWQTEVQKLAAFNQGHGLVGCYQNHAGTKIGASYWEVYQLLQTADPQFFGAQYDIRHAMVEGGLSWQNGFQLLLPHLKTLVLKDFVWGRFNGEWKVVNVPIGEGMVDFDAYFKLLKTHQIQVPVSLHLEYPLGGAEKGHSDLTVAPEVVYQAMSRDLKTVQRLWQKA